MTQPETMVAEAPTMTRPEVFFLDDYDFYRDTQMDLLMDEQNDNVFVPSELALSPF
jgi:hypothetical protein